VVYDYIIVGGGTAGSLVAGKLATQGAKVLVLEAGGSDRNPLISMPAGFVKLLSVARYMWFYESTVQHRLGGRQPMVPCGRVIGGGSSVNAMVYMRGQPRDYDAWVEATGDSSWGWPELLPYFRNLESNERLQNEFHGIDGPLKVSDPVHTCEISRAYVSAAQAAGLQFTDDFNGPEQRGAGYFQLNTHAGKRVSSATAFLHPATKTGNIDIRTGCLVTRLIIENGQARGVEYSLKGSVSRVSCRNEVVLAAGAIATPKILMLSGLGPHSHLQEMGVKTLLDLPGVGQNLQDHTEVPVLSFCNGKYGYFGQDKGWNQIRNGLQYIFFGSGPVASNGVEAGAFFDPDDLSGEPRIQQFCVPSVYLEPGTTDLSPTYGVTLNSCVLQPGSKGSVRLASNRPEDQPMVDTNYFDDPEDLRRSIGGIRQARRILASQPLAGMIEREIFPGPDKKSDEELARHAKQFVKTVYHPVGTARMGRENDEMSVVTPDLKLKGIDGLRIADASVMPGIISGNTNSATQVIADRAVGFMASEG